MTLKRTGLLVLRLLVSVPVVALALTACSLADPATPRDGTSSGSGGATGGATSVEDALARAGLTLPAGAGAATVSRQQLEDRTEAYAVSFTTSRADALAFCDQAGLGGARFVTALPSTAKAGLGDLPVTADSRFCDGVWPDDTSWFRFVLVDAGDPATVHVSLQHMGR